MHKLVVAALLFTACAEADAVMPRPEARPFTPPAEWSGWWTEMENCTHRTGNFRRISWHIATNPPMRDQDGTPLDGEWWFQHDIYLDPRLLTDTVSDWYRKDHVQHEMVHDLEQTGDHTSAFVVCGVLN